MQNGHQAHKNTNTMMRHQFEFASYDFMISHIAPLMNATVAVYIVLDIRNLLPQ